MIGQVKIKKKKKKKKKEEEEVRGRRMADIYELSRQGNLTAIVDLVNANPKVAHVPDGVSDEAWVGG